MLKIIGYHYVNDKNYSVFKNLKSLKIKKFQKQIKFLKKNFNIISLKELSDRKKLPKKSVLLTFDDGYLDHYKNVFPILCKEKISGVFFAPVSTLKQKEILDVNKIQIILHSSKNKKKIFNDLCLEIKKQKLDIHYYLRLIDKFKKDYDLRWHGKYSNNIRNLLQYIIPKKNRKIIINNLFVKIYKYDQKNLIKKMYLNIEQAKEMIKNGMYFGSHGSSHEWLEYLNYRDQYKELENSKKVILELGMKKNLLSICYPFGSYNNKTLKIAKKLNYKVGFANYSENVKNLKKQILNLPRIDTNEI